jgi:alpha-galactosidase
MKHEGGTLFMKRKFWKGTAMKKKFQSGQLIFNFPFFVFLVWFCSSFTAIDNSYAQKFPNMALTPPMGWNSWNKFGCDVNEQLIREIADAMVSSGMKDAGYLYINIDDCWQGQRDSLGFIHPDKARFPHGIKALADYIHSKGLKIGIYSDAGSKTCAGRAGSRGHEYQDALTYAKWGIDYLKYDWCNTEGLCAQGAYMTMRDALYAAGRPIVFSICEWGTNKPWQWARDIGNLWRTTGDISANFEKNIDHGTWIQLSVLSILDQQDSLRRYAGPGHWNDPDMLEVGNGMTVNEDRAHFSMWCMLAAPLIAGNDLRNMSQATKEILTNREVIAVDQDSLGIEGLKYSSTDSVETWFKPLEGGDWAVCFLNRGIMPKKISFDWQRNNVNDTLSGHDTNFGRSVYKIRDLWAKKDIGTTEKIFDAEVPGHDVIMLRLIAHKDSK